MVCARDGGVAGDVGHVEPRIADGLDEDRAGPVVDGRLDGGKVVHRREPRRDATLRQDGVELRVGAAVEIRGGDQFVALAQDVGHGKVNRRRATGEGQRGDTSVKAGQPLFEHIVGRVHHPRIDVAALAQGEEIGAVRGAAKAVGRRAVDRYGARLRRRIGCLAGVQGQSFKVISRVAHLCSGDDGCSKSQVDR